MGMDNVPRCQHIKMNGTQCGSPRLRSRRLCFFHDRIQRERSKIAKDMTAQRRFDLPLLEDANSVQVALMKVMQMLGSGNMDHRTAGLMLYALQTASVTLRNAQFEASEATHVVIDRDDVYRTSIGGPQWFEQDFEDESEEDDEAQSDDGVPDDDEDDDEDDEGDAAAGEVQVIAEAVNETEAVKHITVEEARMKVQGVVRNWLLETMGEKAAAKPD
jgi:hypothetical protein